MTTVLDYESNRIVELMDQPVEVRGADWLKESLQQAILLELATLPPYLCGMWSIVDPGPDERVHQALRTIVFDEMSHLGIACNLLTTIGGSPRLADFRTVPKYPGPLPGGVRPGLTVFLSGLTEESLDLYARIEEPDDPLVESKAAHTSIGAFYTAIQTAFRSHPELITGARQVIKNMGHHGAGNTLKELRTLTAVESAIAVIKEQGEGTSASPENPHPKESGELAHFYAFREIRRGRELAKVPDEYPERWDFIGPEIPLPPRLLMGVVPSGGWPREGPSAPGQETLDRLDEVNGAYSAMLGFIEQAWQQDVPAQATALLGKAVKKMRDLEEPAVALMGTALPDGSGNTYGPEFRYVDT
ncbi:ferritin-like domain-containing protein [Streptomyces sp. 5.8]|uniref:ferritin-like domain-containing protein n=1 Tax=Streptomyces sp. 5.8 TaxID=3406571 RepID=UPI003BB7B485